MARKAIPNRQIAEEAAEWAARIDFGPLEAGDRARLASWLATSPVHVDELLLSASFLAGVSVLDRQATRSIEALLAEPAPEVIPLLTGARALPVPAVADASTPAPRLSFTRAGIGAIAASLLVLVASTFLVLQTAPDSFGPAVSTTAGDVEAGPRLLETGFGEQRSIVLEDGSVLYINTKSQLRVTLSDVERRIELLSGEALFEVAHDPDRPFRVYAGGTIAQAVGTKFNVKQTAEGVSVVVVEGKVLVGRAGELTLREPAVLPSQNGAPGVRDQLLVVAGDRADMPTSGKRPTVSTADIATATSWRLRKVAFNNQGLATIASEFNRYNRRKILVTGQDLGHLRFTGVFDADDPESFVAFLELTAGVEVDKSQPQQITLRAAAD